MLDDITQLFSGPGYDHLNIDFERKEKFDEEKVAQLNAIFDVINKNVS